MPKLKGGEQSETPKGGSLTKVTGSTRETSLTDSKPPDHFPWFYESNIKELKTSEGMLYLDIMRGEFIG